MQGIGLTEDEAMKQLLDCPKLVNPNLEKQVKEINFLFNLYHGMTEAQVAEIFKGFSYLWCCDLKKI